MESFKTIEADTVEASSMYEASHSFASTNQLPKQEKPNLPSLIHNIFPFLQISKTPIMRILVGLAQNYCVSSTSWIH